MLQCAPAREELGSLFLVLLHLLLEQAHRQEVHTVAAGLAHAPGEQVLVVGELLSRCVEQGAHAVGVLHLLEQFDAPEHQLRIVPALRRQLVEGADEGIELLGQELLQHLVPGLPPLPVAQVVVDEPLEDREPLLQRLLAPLEDEQHHGPPGPRDPVFGLVLDQGVQHHQGRLVVVLRLDDARDVEGVDPVRLLEGPGEGALDELRHGGAQLLLRLADEVEQEARAGGRLDLGPDGPHGRAAVALRQQGDHRTEPEAPAAVRVVVEQIEHLLLGHQGLLELLLQLREQGQEVRGLLGLLEHLVREAQAEVPVGLVVEGVPTLLQHRLHPERPALVLDVQADPLTGHLQGQARVLEVDAGREEGLERLELRALHPAEVRAQDQGAGLTGLARDQERQEEAHRLLQGQAPRRALVEALAHQEAQLLALLLGPLGLRQQVADRAVESPGDALLAEGLQQPVVLGKERQQAQVEGVRQGRAAEGDRQPPVVVRP